MHSPAYLPTIYRQPPVPLVLMLYDSSEHRYTFPHKGRMFYPCSTASESSLPLLIADTLHNIRAYKAKASQSKQSYSVPRVNRGYTESYPYRQTIDCIHTDTYPLHQSAIAWHSAKRSYPRMLHEHQRIYSTLRKRQKEGRHIASRNVVTCLLLGLYLIRAY